MKTETQILKEINRIREERRATIHNMRDFGKKYSKFVEKHYFLKCAITLKTLRWVLEENRQFINETPPQYQTQQN